MESSGFTLNTTDQVAVFVYQWFPEAGTRCKGVVQLIHGMAEHAGRYQYFAQALTAAGYLVYAPDLRGHGRTAGVVERTGYLADRNGWQLLVNDTYQLSRKIKGAHPGLPLFLFGHSMGSFLARHYISLHGTELQGVILSGSGGDPGLFGLMGRLLARWECKRKGKRSRSKLLDRLSFGQYNNSFRPVRTAFDWLSRDQAAVDRYIADPFCGMVATAGFFADLLSGIKLIHQPEVVNQIPKTLAVYFIAGDQDPVGKKTAGVREVVRSYQQAGMEGVSCQFYRGARHELLHETNRDEVIQAIIHWLNDHI